METIFVGMTEFETERVYNYGEFKATVTKKNDDGYFINIDSGSYDLINNESDEYSEFNCLKSTINKGWLFDWWCENVGTLESIRVGAFDNDDVFQTNEINTILNAIKNTYEFLKTHNGSVKNIEEQTFNAGKMILKYKKIENDVYQCSIECMKSGKDLEENIYDKYSKGVYCVKFNDNDEFMIDNIKGKSNYSYICADDNYFKFTLMGIPESYGEQYVDINNFKVTTDELEALKIVLKKCSDRLHEINELVKKSKAKNSKIRFVITPHDGDYTTLTCYEGDKQEYCLDHYANKLVHDLIDSYLDNNQKFVIEL